MASYGTDRLKDMSPVAGPVWPKLGDLELRSEAVEMKTVQERFALFHHSEAVPVPAGTLLPH